MEGKGKVKEKGYIYLASPYSHPDEKIREERYRRVMRATADLLAMEVWVYSPIVHCHELAKAHELPTDAEFWRGHNFAMLAKADVVYVLTLPGWEESKGIKGEIGEAKRLGKEVVVWDGLWRLIVPADSSL